MIGRGAHEGQAEGDIHAFVEGQRLDRDQRLIVIHRDGRVIPRPRRRVKHRIGRVGAGQRVVIALHRLDQRSDPGDLLVPHGTAFARVRIEAGDGDAGMGNAELVAQPGDGDLDGPAHRWHGLRLTPVGERIGCIYYRLAPFQHYCGLPPPVTQGSQQFPDGVQQRRKALHLGDGGPGLPQGTERDLARQERRGRHSQGAGVHEQARDTAGGNATLYYHTAFYDRRPRLFHYGI